MLRFLKRSYYARSRGQEESELILRVEEAVARLPASLATDAWCRWLWSLPHEAWEEAVRLREGGRTLIEQRERLVRTITRKNRLRAGDLSAEDAIVADREVDALRSIVSAQEEEYRRQKARFIDSWGDLPD